MSRVELNAKAIPEAGSGHIKATDIADGSVDSSKIDSPLSTLAVVNIEATAYKLGPWEILLDGDDLKFVFDGVDVFKFTTAGSIVSANSAEIETL